MSEPFTEADVAAARAACQHALNFVPGTDLDVMRAVLARVAPAMRDRWQAEALWEAADALTVIADTEQGDAEGVLLGAALLLRARAERIGGDPQMTGWTPPRHFKPGELLDPDQAARDKWLDELANEAEIGGLATSLEGRRMVARWLRSKRAGGDR